MSLQEATDQGRTFGLAGRLACTAVLALPVWRFLATGSLFWLFLVIGASPLGAWFLRETWRRYQR